MTILVLLLLSALLYGRLVRAAQRNSTVDDRNPLVKYHATMWSQTTQVGLDGSQLYNATVTFVHPYPNETPTISIDFTGTAVYIFVAYPSGKKSTVPIGFSAWIDDTPAGGWTADQIAPLSNHLAFSTTALSNGPHTLVLELCLQCSLYFDYAIITSDPDPIGTSSSAAEPTTPTPTLPVPTSFGNNNAAVSTLTVSASVPAATGDVAIANGKSSSALSVSISTVNAPASTSPGGVAVATSTGNTPVPTDSDKIPVQASTGHKQTPIAAIVGGVLGAVVLLGLVLTPLVLRRRALARKAKARDTFSPFLMWKTDEDRHTDEENDGNTRGPPLTPLVLHPPPPARFASLRENLKSPLRVTIPTGTAIPEAPTRTPGTEASQTPLSAVNDVALMQIAEQMRRMRMSMQRLETGIPEARDGGSALMRPPAYGSGDRQSQA
ncbi:hypothetical protein DFH08DRAFT_75857 [Mycena albidolilacea]|uniref:Uncharacterized protein n=1 Tax=Mycena albidolilacea TaxID=1033008 RepID=A0AAD6YZN3_9AGAR|nr:hypothetical protein DFH08DRAFT_75857 [Mycena albidolilacea]